MKDAVRRLSIDADWFAKTFPSEIGGELGAFQRTEDTHSKKASTR